MTRKFVSIEPKPGARTSDREVSAEQWIRSAAATSGRSTKRLTIDIDENLHRRLRVLAATEGRTMADVVRALLDDACPEDGR